MMEYDIRCFTNTLEKICTVVAYYFYMKMGADLNLHMLAFGAMLTVSFIMRNTSPVGWLPLLALKVFRDGAFIPLFMAALIIAVPILLGTVYMDSLYYSKDKEFRWVFTFWNFIRDNVLYGYSKYFGDSQFLEYMINFLPVDIFKALFPFLIHGVYSFIKDR